MLNQKGSAVLEMIPVIIVVMVLLRYSYGFFGVIHSATLQSIAARNYAFETFRHRSQLTYLREYPPISPLIVKFTKGSRLHGIVDRKTSRNQLGGSMTIERKGILFPFSNPQVVGPTSFQSRVSEQSRLSPGRRFGEGDGTDYVWLAIRYGFCIDSTKCN